MMRSNIIMKQVMFETGSSCSSSVSGNANVEFSAGERGEPKEKSSRCVGVAGWGGGWMGLVLLLRSWSCFGGKESD